MPLPVQTISPFDAQLAADVAAVIAPGEPGVVQADYYRSTTTVNSISVRISQRALTSSDAGAIGRPPPGGRQTERKLWMLTVKALQAGEDYQPGDMVGEASGVIELKKGDVFIVPGRCVGMPSEASVMMTVAGSIEFRGGYWTCEISL